MWPWKKHDQQSKLPGFRYEEGQTGCMLYTCTIYESTFHILHSKLIPTYCKYDQSLIHFPQPRENILKPTFSIWSSKFDGSVNYGKEAVFFLLKQSVHIKQKEETLNYILNILNDNDGHWNKIN